MQNYTTMFSRHPRLVVPLPRAVQPVHGAVPAAVQHGATGAVRRAELWLPGTRPGRPPVQVGKGHYSTVQYRKVQFTMVHHIRVQSK